MELDAVPGEDERLAVERHRHPAPKQLRILRHLSLPLFDRSPREDEEDDSRISGELDSAVMLRVKGRWGRLRRAVLAGRVRVELT